MKFAVEILPREVILDTQGRAVEQILKQNQMQVSQCRIGRYIEIETPLTDEKKALAEIQKMTEFILYNPLIETYKIHKISEAKV